MEDYMNNHRHEENPYMMSFSEPHLISICANEIGQGSNLPNAGMSLTDLNERYLEGLRINTDNIYYKDVNSTHISMEYKFD